LATILVATARKKLHIVIVIDVKVTFQTGLPMVNQNHSVGSRSLKNGSHFSLDGRLHTALMHVELCTTVSGKLTIAIITLFLGHAMVLFAMQKCISC